MLPIGAGHGFGWRRLTSTGTAAHRRKGGVGPRAQRMRALAARLPPRSTKSRRSVCPCGLHETNTTPPTALEARSARQTDGERPVRGGSSTATAAGPRPAPPSRAATSCSLRRVKVGAIGGGGGGRGAGGRQPPAISPEGTSNPAPAAAEGSRPRGAVSRAAHMPSAPPSRHRCCGGRWPFWWTRGAAAARALRCGPRRGRAPPSTEPRPTRWPPHWLLRRPPPPGWPRCRAPWWRFPRPPRPARPTARSRHRRSTRRAAAAGSEADRRGRRPAARRALPPGRGVLGVARVRKRVRSYTCTPRYPLQAESAGVAQASGRRRRGLT